MRATISRHAHFNAAHRLHNPRWDDQKNARVFGVCNNPHYHGHNYELIVSLTGPIDPDTGKTKKRGNVLSNAQKKKP